MLLRAYRDGDDPKDDDGWLPTGDAGSFEDGRLSVHGRVGDLIITGGENVWPVAVERVLRTHPGVAEVLVVGRADPEWGQRVVAIVVPTDPSAAPASGRPAGPRQGGPPRVRGPEGPGARRRAAPHRQREAARVYGVTTKNDAALLPATRGISSRVQSEP